MKFKKILEVKKINTRKIVVYSIIRLVMTIVLLYSSFFVIGVPIFFIFLYLILFIALLVLSSKYDYQELKFWKNKEGKIFVDLGYFSNICYIISTISRIIISSIGMIIKFDIFNRIGINTDGLNYTLFDHNFTYFIILTICLDILLIYSKATLLGIYRKMYIKSKRILSGQDEVKDIK